MMVLRSALYTFTLMLISTHDSLLNFDLTSRVTVHTVTVTTVEMLANDAK